MAHAQEKPQFPAHFYHPELGTKYVASDAEAKLLGPGWGRTYQHQEFPKMLHHPQKGAVTVKSDDELDALGDGWFESKAEADAAAKAKADEITEKHVAFLQSRGRNVADVDAARKFVDSLAPNQKARFMKEAAAYTASLSKSDDWDNPEADAEKQAAKGKGKGNAN